MTEPHRSKRFPIIIGVAGIVLEIVALWLLSTKRIPTTIASPLIIVGMFMAFVPIFVAARRARK